MDENMMMNPLHLIHLIHIKSPNGVSYPIRCLLKDAARSGNQVLLEQVITELRHGTLGGEMSVAEMLEMAKDNGGRTLLHLAAAWGHVAVCSYLVEELKLDVNVKDNTGDTPLNHAILKVQHDTSVYLLDHGAWPTVPNDYGFSALHYTAISGNTYLMQLLVSKGADVDEHSKGGSPLYDAVVGNKRNVIEFFLENNADPNLIVEPLDTPLMSAIRNQSIESVRLLLKAGADPNVGSYAANPLTLAAYDGDTKILKCLLEAGADPNKKDKFDLTPLEIGAIQGNHEVVRELFPLTMPLPSVPVWSFHGFYRYVLSDEAKRQLELSKKRKFEEAKSNGTAAFSSTNYVKAASWNTSALSVDPTDAAVLSNRSLCWVRLGKGDKAVSDARACIELRKNWPKAHYRLGDAYKVLKDFEKATRAYKKGLELDPHNKEIQDALKEVLNLEAAAKDREATENREMEACERMEEFGSTQEVRFCEDGDTWYEFGIGLANE